MSKIKTKLTKSTSEIEDDRLLQEIQDKFGSTEHNCSYCGDKNAQIPCMDRCGTAFYCSNDCALHHAKRHRDDSLKLRLSYCDELEDFNDEEQEENTDVKIDENFIDEPLNEDESILQDDAAFVDHFSDISVQRQGIIREKSIRVTCPHCSATTTITRKFLTDGDKQKASARCECGEVVGFWI